MSAIDQALKALELQMLPGQIFEAIHPAIDFNRGDGENLPMEETRT